MMNTCVQVKSIKQSSQLLSDQFGGCDDQITTFRKTVSEGRISLTAHRDLTRFLSCLPTCPRDDVTCEVSETEFLSRHRKKSSWFSVVVHMSCLSHNFHPNIVKIVNKFWLFITLQSVLLNHSENIRDNEKTSLKELQSKLKNPV